MLRYDGIEYVLIRYVIQMNMCKYAHVEQIIIFRLILLLFAASAIIVFYYKCIY